MLDPNISEEQLNGLQDAVKVEYTKQSDGMYRLQVKPKDGWALEDVTDLKSTVVATRSERDDAQAQLKAFKGIDPAKARDAMEKIGEMANWKPEEKVAQQIEVIKTQLEDKHAAELTKKDEALTKVTAMYQKVKIEDAALQSFIEQGGRKQSAKPVLAYVREVARMRQTDGGDFLTEIKDEQGNARLSPATGSTAPMAVAELIAEMKDSDAFAPLFDGTGATGTGASGGNGALKGKMSAEEFAKLPPAQRMQKAKELGINQ